MSTFALRLPDSLYAHARKLAEQDQASLNQFITVAVADADGQLISSGAGTATLAITCNGNLLASLSDMPAEAFDAAPSIRAAGSPGMKRISAKTVIDTITTVGSAISSMLSFWEWTSTSASRFQWIG